MNEDLIINYECPDRTPNTARKLFWAFHCASGISPSRDLIIPVPTVSFAFSAYQTLNARRNLCFLKWSQYLVVKANSYPIFQTALKYRKKRAEIKAQSNRERERKSLKLLCGSKNLFLPFSSFFWRKDYGKCAKYDFISASSVLLWVLGWFICH